MRRTPARRSASETTSPITISAGAWKPAAASAHALEWTLAGHGLLSGSVPREITAAGVAAGRPAATRPSAICSSAEPHEEHERPAGRAEPRVVGLAAVGGVPARDRDAVGDAAVRDRDQGRGRNGCDRRDAGHDLERRRRPRQRERLLAAATEDERVAALQANDVEAAPAEATSSRSTSSWSMPSREIRSASVGRLLDELLGDERVVDEHVARADELEPAGGDQARVARARRRRGGRSPERLLHEAGEVLAPLLVRREVRLRPGPQLAQRRRARRARAARPRDLVPQPLRQRGRGAAGRDGDRDRLLAVDRRGG